MAPREKFGSSRMKRTRHVLLARRQQVTTMIAPAGPIHTRDRVRVEIAANVGHGR